MKNVYNHLDYDWQNIKIQHKGRMLTRPFYCSYETQNQALGGRKEKSPHYTCLNGDWLFAYFESPFLLPEGITEKEYPTGSFSLTPVPSHWQFNGYGHPHYTDDVALMGVKEQPVVPYKNPTGVYRKSIMVAKNESLEYILRFDGVESAYHLFVNGIAVGYSQVSHNTSEFEISSHLADGENIIVVIVYQYHEGSLLEVQDMWTLAGIIRDVSLITRPKIHLSDYQLLGDLDEDYTKGILRLKVLVSNNLAQKTKGTLTVTVLDEGRVVVSVEKKEVFLAGQNSELIIEETVENVNSWTAETPYLYDLLMTLEVEGQRSEYYHQKFGFRTVELKKGLMLLNGKYIKLRGMNRHDWSGDTGRVVTPEQMQKDLELMKSLNINAVRTAHYPNMPIFYEMCDEMGFYVVSEADLECNETYWIKDPNLLSHSIHWKESYLDRVERMVRRDKNVTSIIMWSLGNESGYGNNFISCYDFCHNYDPSRLVHYEEDRQAIGTDVYSSMYTNHNDLEAIGKRTDLYKPHILCEYAHAMGNSPGGLEEYWEIINRYPRLQGAFLWEWIAHGIKGIDENGTAYYRYGGDFGDTPNTGKFCTSGIVAPDRTPFPGVAQLKKALEPVKTTVNFTKKTCTVKNLLNFVDLSDYRLECNVTCDGKILDRFTVDLRDIPAMTHKELSLEKLEDNYLAFAESKVWLNCIYYYKNTPSWGKEQTVLTQSQFPLPEKMISRKSVKKLTLKPIEVTEKNHTILVKAGECVYTFDVASGLLTGMITDHKQLIEEPFDFTFWRAPIDNDRFQLVEWNKYFVATVLNNNLKTKISFNKDTFTMVSTKTYTPYTKDWCIDIVMTYTVTSSGIDIHSKGIPLGELPPTLPRIGITCKLNTGYEKVDWIGHGPESNYIDAKAGTPVGRYEKMIDELYVPYIIPQEHASRSGVTCLQLTGDLPTIKITSKEVFSFSASHYSTQMLEKALHTNDLVKDEGVYLHIDHRQHGLGSSSWGPEPLANATLRPEPFAFTIHLTTKTEKE